MKSIKNYLIVIGVIFLSVSVWAESKSKAISELEKDILIFGVFPNSAGLMDGKFYFRKTYEMFSSGLYFDYLTLKESYEKEGKSKSDALTKEYRIDSDLFKAIFVLARSSSFRFSLEPGANFKYILRNTESSGYQKNPDKSIVFSNENKDVQLLGGSGKLEISMSMGKYVSMDLMGEYIPLLYSTETGEKFVSTFDTPVEYELENATSGIQTQVDLIFADFGWGRNTIRFKMFQNMGEISTEASVVNGNFETKIETFDNFTERLMWLEFYHSMKYLIQYLKIAPVLSFSWQLNEKKIGKIESTNKSVKFGVLAEFF
jgi:hypothetical protein